MANHSTQHGLGTIARLVVLMSMTGTVMNQPALAQAKKESDKAASVFDDEKTAGETKDEKTKGAAKGPTVSDRDTIGFSQQNAAAQMNELEERMFRLSEALRGLEPENASRLKLALKFSREEQILEQMRETNKMLKEAQLSKAETEAKELIAKLEHLRNLLLAEDLDFQLKLARLRQMRETLSQLERIIKEEKRELGWSRFALDQRKRLARYTTRRPDLEALVRDQQAVIADTKNLSKDGKKDSEKDKDARAAIREREVKVRNATSALAIDPLFADLQPPHLRRADGDLADAVSSLEGSKVSAAIEAEEKGLGRLREEFTRLDDQVAQTNRTIADAEFQRRASDQGKNRGATENLQEISVRLGEVSVALRKDLIHASASMRSAEQSLGKTAAAPAAEDQTAALDALTKSYDEFSRAVDRLLVELRSELQNRLIAELTEMYEMQTSIRETTQAQAPKVLQKSRTALIMVAGLSKEEAKLGERTEHLLALVEETEFGIALPTTLRILSREMRTIEGWLGAGDVASHTIELETRVAEDLLAMVHAVRRLPPTTPPAPGDAVSQDEKEQERETNRVIAELKLVRMIQSRLNDDTVVVDKTRAASSTTPPAIRREVETLESTQDEIRDALAKIAERLAIPQDNQ